MSTIDAAIIKALVEHVGGDSSGGTDGTIGGNSAATPPGSGGKTYTAGDAIDLTDSKISVKYDSATMQLVDGKISALPQSGGSGVVLSAGDAINIADNKIGVKYDESTMELKDGKLAAKCKSSRRFGGYTIEGVVYDSIQLGFTGFTEDNIPPIIKFSCTDFYGTGQDITFYTFIDSLSDPRNNQMTLSTTYYMQTNDVYFTNKNVYSVGTNISGKTWSLTGYDSVNGEIIDFLLKHVAALYQAKSS